MLDGLSVVLDGVAVVLDGLVFALDYVVFARDGIVVVLAVARMPMPSYLPPPTNGRWLCPLLRTPFVVDSVTLLCRQPTLQYFTPLC